MAAQRKNLGQLLNSLIELDHDAVAAYEAAIERLDNPQYRMRMTEFLDDHQHHIVTLTPLTARYTHKVAHGPDLKGMFATGKVLLAGLVGDRAILSAMLDHEHDTNHIYARAVAHADLPVDVLATLLRNLADERRHRAWIEDTLSRRRRDSVLEAVSPRALLQGESPYPG